MNLSQVRELKDGDKVKFIIPFPAFKTGREYEVRKFDDGEAYVYDDNGKGWPMVHIIYCNDHFERKI
ncbi:hypothetical protein LCGC14_2100240 [marine sediment metagenome]|uniref:Uncharacterized protein n=1 Tax=marine sediment metagenome TaxID=412755 RepID=A0A0F9EXE2_9ZZZZ